MSAFQHETAYDKSIFADAPMCKTAINSGYAYSYYYSGYIYAYCGQRVYHYRWSRNHYYG